MDRRLFLGGLGITVLGLSACATGAPGALDSAVAPSPSTTPDPAPSPSEAPSAAPEPAPEPEPPHPIVDPQWDLPGGPIYGLPTGVGNKIAWTVDDGASAEVVQAYAVFARDTGTRLTFFINGIYPGWEAALPVLAPLVASGQVQIANHTYSHAGLTQLSDAQIQDELMVNHERIQQLFGVDARPWYRPPFGWRDERTDAAAAAVGYTTPTMWYGSLGDSGLLAPEVMLSEANKWLNAETIILGHANAPTVTGLFPQLLDILGSRGLETVTLNDVFRV